MLPRAPGALERPERRPSFRGFSFFLDLCLFEMVGLGKVERIRMVDSKIILLEVFFILFTIGTVQALIRFH